MKRANIRAWFMVVFLLWVFDLSSAIENAAEPHFLKGKKWAVWVTVRNTPIYSSLSPRSRLKFANLGEGLEIIGIRGAWLNVVDEQGKKGWIEKRCTDSTWILIVKKEHKLLFLDGREVIKEWGADFGVNSQGDKEREGDGKTPEGELYVCAKIANSMFYKAFLLSYPSIHHAQRGLESGLINQSQYNAILKAIKQRSTPPQNTPLSAITLKSTDTGRAGNTTGHWDALGCPTKRWTLCFPKSKLECLS
jgi:hypothetical protein